MMTETGLVYRVEGRIPDVVLILVSLVAVGAFALSYHNLVMAASQAGIPSYLSPAFPLTVDAFLAIGSLTVLRNNLREESTLTGWAVLIVFTLVSIILNVSVGNTDLLSIACHAIPPASLAVSLELFTGFIRSDLTIRPDQTKLAFEPEEIPSNEPGSDQVCEEKTVEPSNTRRRSVDVTNEQIITLFEQTPCTIGPSPAFPVEHNEQGEQGGQDDYVDQVVYEPEMSHPRYKPIISVTDDQIIDFFGQQPSTSLNQAAKTLGVVRSTLTRRVNKLVKQGKLTRPGIPAYSAMSETKYRSSDSVEPVH